MKAMRVVIGVLVVSALLVGCTTVIHLRNAKTGQTATCGGEMWTPLSAGKDDHCVQYFHKQGFDPVQ